MHKLQEVLWWFKCSPPSSQKKIGGVAFACNMKKPKKQRCVWMDGRIGVYVSRGIIAAAEELQAAVCTVGRCKFWSPKKGLWVPKCKCEESYCWIYEEKFPDLCLCFGSKLLVIHISRSIFNSTPKPSNLVICCAEILSNTTA